MEPATGKLKCIDVKGYLVSDPYNKNFLDDNNCIEVNRLSGNNGVNGHAGYGIDTFTINIDEWKYFEPYKVSMQNYFVSDTIQYNALTPKSPKEDVVTISEPIQLDSHTIITNEEYSRLKGIEERYSSIIEIVK